MELSNTIIGNPRWAQYQHLSSPPSPTWKPLERSLLLSPSPSTMSSSSCSSSAAFSEEELAVAAILESLPVLVPLERRFPLRWARKRPRSHLKKLHQDPSGKVDDAVDDDNPTSSSSPVSPLFFSFDQPSLHPVVKDLRVKEKARVIARLRDVNRSLQLEAERERMRYEALLVENSRLKSLRASRGDDAAALPPRLWTLGGIYAYGVPPSEVGFPACPVPAWEEDRKRAAMATARRRRIEINRRRKAERAAAS